MLHSTLSIRTKAMMVVILVTFAAILFFYFRYFLNSKYKHFGSPGPCLPLIGHSYVMMTKEAKKDPAQRIWSLYKKHQKHGMLYFKSIGMNQLLIGDFETIKYIFNHSDGNGRINDQISRFTKITRKVQKCKDFPGLIMSEGETWKQQRRFSLRTLRDFGFGKQGLEELIMDEVKMFKHLLDTEVGKPIDIATKLNLPILNALWKVTVGERFDYDDPRLLDICQRLTETFKVFVGTKFALNSYPWMRRLFSKWLSTDFILQSLHDVIDLMKENILKHQQTLDVNSPRDYTDMVLKEIENTTDESSSFHGSVGLDNLKVALFDLFLAGSETTSTTLTWASLYMVRYPEVQARVQQELARVVGEDRSPAMEDRPRLPYTEAVIMEVQRHANIVPLGLRHRITRDMVVSGQLVPAGTMVMPLMAEILKGDYWGDGEVFRPERFLDEAGQLRKEERFIPFSTGKRACLGEALARAELFLFLSSLLQHFTLLPAVEGELPPEEWQFGITSLPKPFKLKLKHRLE